MAAKENLSTESYERQISGLAPFIKYERPTSKSPIRLYQDQDDRIRAIAKTKGKSRAKVIRDAIDFYLYSIDQQQNGQNQNDSQTTPDTTATTTNQQSNP